MFAFPLHPSMTSSCYLFPPISFYRNVLYTASFTSLYHSICLLHTVIFPGFPPSSWSLGCHICGLGIYHVLVWNRTTIYAWSWPIPTPTYLPTQVYSTWRFSMQKSRRNIENTALVQVCKIQKFRNFMVPGTVVCT